MPYRRAFELEAQLRSLLDRDRVDPGIVAARGNKINRKHYAQKIGCSPANLARFEPVFSEYERELQIATGPLRHLSEMRKWLAAAYDNRELQLRDGKIDRAAFQERFELRGGAFMTRHSQIRELIEEYDARVERDGYLSASRQEELDRLRAVLAGTPILNKEWLTINQVELAKAAQVPQIRLRDKPFADAIATREAEILTEVQASRIDPYVHGRVFPFSHLTTLWPTTFLERVGVRFKQIAAGLAQQTAKNPYLSLVGALTWIGSSSNPNCRAVVAEAVGKGRVLAVAAWEDALFAYREHLVAGIAAGSETDSSVDHAISSLRPMLDALSTAQVVPETSMALPGVKHSRRRSGHLRSIAEACATDTSGAAPDYVSFARDRFLQACKTSGTDLGMGDSEEFIRSLAIGLHATANLPMDPETGVRLVLERRLEALRAHAFSIVDAAVEAHQRGRELLSLAEIDGAEFERAYLNGELNAHQRRQLVTRFFPDPEGSSDQGEARGIANLLALIEQQRGGIPPRGGTDDGTPYGQFFAKRYLAYGGLKTIAPLLNPEADAVGAALTLYLIESGANVSVGRTLDRACIEASDLEGYCRVTGHKARAKGKPIIVDLPDNSAAVRAIEWLNSVGGRLQASAGGDNDRLFLMRIGGRVQMMTPHWYTSWFKDFATSTPGLEEVRLLPNMIRPSVLLHASLSNDGRLAVGMAIGQHGLGVTQGYQQKWPTRLLYDETIRRFQAAFETLVMSGIEDAASKLGITTEQFEARLGNLQATGLGTYCKDRRGRPGSRGEVCSTLDCWDGCPHLLIVAEIEAIAALQLWQASLRSVQPDWERDRPERWDEIWLPWLCLTDVVEEKMSRGPLIKIWAAAQKRSAEVSAQPGYVSPRPW
ncbi:hypothetical protein [Methylobacterium sp.]|uniref:hypothetical protein n=1 Tax=Methylobacterium sp. TaxID=409 RepID=UPI003AFFC3B9